MKISLAQLLGKYKTLKHAYTAYMDAGKVVVDLKYWSWNYIRDIVTGHKILIDKTATSGMKLPPRYSY
jgi:hypothetical protein